MRVLAVSMSPRPDGNTGFLLGRVMKGIVDAGGSVELVRTHELDIIPCTGCGGCARTGVCVLRDSFIEVEEKLVSYDGVIFAAPLYFMNVPARGKALIDRLQSLWIAKHRLGSDRCGAKRRPGMLIACAGHAFGPGGTDVFRGLEDTMTYVFDALGLVRIGGLLLRRVDHPGETELDDTICERAFRLGVDFIKEGFRVYAQA